MRSTGSVEREKQDPKTGLEPLSLVLFAICGLSLVLGGGYIGAKAAGFSFGKTMIDHQLKSPDVAGGGAEKTELEKYIDAGAAAYVACTGCHQSSGKGLGMIPPLVNSEWVNEGTERFAQIILNGLRGPITVAGDSYGAQEMPAQKVLLKDKQIAQVMTYVRHKFGGVTDIVVTPEMIAEARKKHGERNTPYTAGELAPADAMLPGDQPAWANPDAAPEAPPAEGGEGGAAPESN